MKNRQFTVLFVYSNKMLETLISINLSALSAVLKERGFEVKLFDTTYYRTEEKSGYDVRVENLQLRSFDLSKYGVSYRDTDMYGDFRALVKDLKPDIIGLTAVEDTYEMGMSLLRSVRDLGVPSIVGGVHAVISPDEVIADPSVDMVCTGEGENAFAELCEKMRDGKDFTDVRGIWFKKGGAVIKNRSAELTDINTMPHLDFTIYEKERFYRPMQGKVYRMLPVEVSRGCPFSCTYCAAPKLREIYKASGTYYRKKSIERVIDEIKFYRDRYGMDYVYFTAETFLSMNDADFRKFVELYKDIKIPFWGQTRPETVTAERIKALEGIGCDRLTVGIESGNERVRRKILNRNVSNDSIIRAFDILAGSSIPVSVNNVIGIPDETREEIFDTIELNRRVGSDSTSVFIFTPYRGTALRQHCIDKGYMDSDDSYHADIRKKSILKMPTLSDAEIRGLLRTFPLYVKFPKSEYDAIRAAEKFDEQGDLAFRKLSERYRKEYFKQ
jgi:radical SAM superfamily enzyme YgiQ (UPF0313 family)